MEKIIFISILCLSLNIVFADIDEKETVYPVPEDAWPNQPRYIPFYKKDCDIFHFYDPKGFEIWKQAELDSETFKTAWKEQVSHVDTMSFSSRKQLYKVPVNVSSAYVGIKTGMPDDYYRKPFQESWFKNLPDSTKKPGRVTLYHGFISSGVCRPHDCGDNGMEWVWNPQTKELLMQLRHGFDYFEYLGKKMPSQEAREAMACAEYGTLKDYEQRKQLNDSNKRK